MKHENALAIGLNAVAEMPPANFAGTWINEQKSRMELMVSDDQVVGSYTSAVSGSIGPLRGINIGTVSGRAIAFTVNWQNGAVTSGIGHLVDGNGDESLRTPWHLAFCTPNPGDPSELWESVLSGTDRFHRKAHQQKC
jgi:hypothetical protein